MKNIMPKAVYFTSTTETYNQEDVQMIQQVLMNVMRMFFQNLSLVYLIIQQSIWMTNPYNNYAHRNMKLTSPHIQHNHMSICRDYKDPKSFNTWKLHRAGRITASNFHEVMHFQYRSNASSLLYNWMQYSAQPIHQALNMCREMEEKADNFHASLMQSYHENFYC